MTAKHQSSIGEKQAQEEKSDKRLAGAVASRDKGCTTRANRTTKPESPSPWFVQAGYIALESRLSLLETHAQSVETIKSFEGAVVGSAAFTTLCPLLK